MAGSGRTGSRRRATRCRRRELDVDDVLLNENHAPADGRRQGQGALELPPLQLFPASSATKCRNVTDERRPAGHVALRQGDRLRARRAGLAGVHPCQPHPEEARPHRALPSAVGAMAAPAPSSRSTSGRRGQFYLVSAGALERHDHDIAAQASARRTAASTSSRSRRLTACWCSPARARARCCKSSPTPTSPTPPSPGSPASRSRSGRRRATRCASISSASSDGNCTTRSRCRTRIFDLLMKAGAALRHQALRHPRHDVDGAGEILPAGRARTVHRIRCARIRPRPLRASEQGRLPRPRRAGGVARAGLRQPLRHAWRCTA